MFRLLSEGANEAPDSPEPDVPDEQTEIPESAGTNYAQIVPIRTEMYDLRPADLSKRACRIDAQPATVANPDVGILVNTPTPVSTPEQRSYIEMLLDGYVPQKDPSIQIAQPGPGERTSEWVGADMLEEIASYMPSPVDDVIRGENDFIQNYFEMRHANVKGADRWFHCMANCEATARGFGGEFSALTTGYGREALDLPKNVIFKGLSWQESLLDMKGDLEANRVGRDGAHNGLRCNDACNQFKPKGL